LFRSRERHAELCDYLRALKTRYAGSMSADERASEFDPKRYPAYYLAAAGGGYAAYRASSFAINQFGHRQIIAGLQMFAAHETGAIRHYNVDAVPVEGCLEQLVLVRSVLSGEVVALTEREYRRDLNWPLP
jgi:hypothetical protein